MHNGPSPTKKPCLDASHVVSQEMPSHINDKTRRACDDYRESFQPVAGPSHQYGTGDGESRSAYTFKQRSADMLKMERSIEPIKPNLTINYKTKNFPR